MKLARKRLKILFAYESSVLSMPGGYFRDKTYLNDTLRNEIAEQARQAEIAVERVF
jgi:hypothetical protein